MYIHIYIYIYIHMHIFMYIYTIRYRANFRKYLARASLLLDHSRHFSKASSTVHCIVNSVAS